MCRWNRTHSLVGSQNLRRGVYRVLTSCHAQLLQLWLALISCCSRWINKGNMTQSSILVAVVAFWCSWGGGTSFTDVVLMFCFFFLLPSCKVSHSTSESKHFQLETFCQDVWYDLKTWEKKEVETAFSFSAKHFSFTVKRPKRNLFLTRVLTEDIILNSKGRCCALRFQPRSLFYSLISNIWIWVRVTQQLLQYVKTSPT